MWHLIYVDGWGDRKYVPLKLLDIRKRKEAKIVAQEEIFKIRRKTKGTLFCPREGPAGPKLAWLERI